MSNALADSNTVIGRTAMVAGEVLLPGASSLIRGDIGTGVGTFVAAGAAAAILAPSMPLMAALAAIGLRVNSYKIATTGTNLLTSVADALPHKPAATPAKAA
ncbi:DUF6072 family protein [Sphingomonas sp. PR090111-T3T-6A]|uniref:DUF6072 family protein n=1 Tax=Sphingomonas sp. PR090111-T3T-6A TaxID=685778 RepID=UPI0003657658|nr:DUF6072 family protein [Sphingomonas sp. PR090111-T3T-6A]